MSTILADFTPSIVAAAIEANIIASCKSWVVWPQLEYYDEGDLTWILTNIPFPLFNNVLQTQLSSGLDARIEAILARVKARDVPLSWWVGPSSQPDDLGNHLAANGLLLAGSPQGMAVDLDRVNEHHAIPAELSIEQVTDARTFLSWCRVMAPVFDIPDFAAEAWFEIFTEIGFGLTISWQHYLARLEGVPVATSSLFLGAGVAGISNVATVPGARGRGVGTAITLAPLLEARRKGYRIGTLLSSTMGSSIYRRLGFQDFFQGHYYVWLNH